MERKEEIKGRADHRNLSFDWREMEQPIFLTHQPFSFLPDLKERKGRSVQERPT